MSTVTPARTDYAMDQDSAAPPPVTLATPPPEITREERRLRFWMKFWSASFAIEVLLYLWWAFDGGSDSRGFAVNSVAKDLTFLVLGLLVISDVRRFGRLMTVLVLGHLAIALSIATLLIFGVSAVNFPGLPGPLFGIDIPSLPDDLRLPIWLAAASFATAHMGWLHVTARRARHGLGFLSPLQYDTLVALAETVISKPRVPATQTATDVDRYWTTFNGRGQGRVKLALVGVYVWSLLTTGVPFGLKDAEGRRKFVERRFIGEGLMSPSLVRAAIRFAIQLVYMGYYSDRAAQADTGYVPFSERTADPPPKVHSKLKTIRPDRVTERELEADVVIVGTGAAAGVLADRLVAAGHDVLMIERGDFVDPSTFTENETEMYSRLYSDGAIQLSRDFSFQVLQGRCVGGGTVVNNAVCFDLPREVLDQWNLAGAGLPASLDPSFAAVRKLMRVTPQDLAPRSPGVDKVVRAINELGLDRDPYRSARVDANINDCKGCGYCNIGCAYGKKMSMLDLVLPDAQCRADDRRTMDPEHRGRLRVLPTCEVTRIERDGVHGGGSGRTSGVRCVVGADRRELRVKAGTVVVAAGAIHSSRLLQSSKIGGSQVGRGLCANIATFMTGDFGDRLTAYDGLQLAHYIAPPQERGYVIETWFNPVVITALSMPGWLGDHQHNMSRYDHMMCMGVLVGTDPLPGNRVKRSLLGSDYSFKPSSDVLERLAAALKEAGEVLFEAGAQRVMPSTFDFRPYARGERMDDLESLLKKKGNASLQSSHPQGGNAVSADPATGVVDPTFRVHGYDNLYVCDASVFPTATTVNPQLTVMALADHAASHPDGLGAL